MLKSAPVSTIQLHKTHKSEDNNQIHETMNIDENRN